MKSRPVGTNESILASDGNSRRDDGRGGSFLLAHQQLGLLALPTNPSNGQTLTVTVNGTAIPITFVTTIGSTPNNVLIGSNAETTGLFLTNFLRRPDLTTFSQIAASNASQQLLQYVGWAYPGSTTSIVPFSLNKTLPGITGNLTSFNITTTVTSGSWTAQTMQLYVEDGTYYINGTRYLFTGGSTPTVTAPVSQRRIDVLTIDTSGTLAWTTGTEAASPTAPAYPENKLAICELYNAVSETALYDFENEQSSEGYILNDVRPSMSYGPSFSAFPEDIIPDAANTRSLGSSGNQWLNIYGENIYNNGALVAATKFGGTGVDGALSIASSTTTINCANAAVVVKNYTSISITGTGALAFSNPHANGTIIVLKSQGNVTITSSASPAIDVRSMGATTGNDGQGLIRGPRTSIAITVYGNEVISGGNEVTSWLPGSGVRNTTVNGKGVNVYAGAAGTTGSSGAGSGSGSGGPGGGGLYIECAGTLNFTGSINSSGSAGANGTGSNTFNTLSQGGDGGGSQTDGTLGIHYTQIPSSQPGAGGGGGGAGSVCILYNFLTANTGTITVSGGSGGTGGNSVAGGAGASGWSLVVQNTEFS